MAELVSRLVQRFAKRQFHLFEKGPEMQPFRLWQGSEQTIGWACL
jgi:hypothetical protein